LTSIQKNTPEYIEELLDFFYYFLNYVPKFGNSSDVNFNNFVGAAKRFAFTKMVI
jgi:hypothetical protein